MIFLLDTSSDFNAAQSEVGLPCGELITPITRRTPRGGSIPFAIDNGAFAGFDPKGFRSLLARERPRRERCLFVAAPDVVGSARRTLEVWRQWEGELVGWKRALVLQDGIEDLEIPWPDLDAVFVGGSTRFKTSDAALACAHAAKALSKWVHVGRVNTPERMERWQDVADSADGTGVSRYTHMRMALTTASPLLPSCPT